MELFFLLIFFAFILLNVVIGLVSSRAKKRKAALQRSSEEYAPGAPEPDRREEEVSDERGIRGGNAYFLQEQTSDTLVRSMYEEAEAPLEKQEQMPDYPGHSPGRLDEGRTAPKSDRDLSSQLLETPLEEGEEYYAPGSGWEQLKRLPSLQRAVILSEILGPPPALSERTHSHQ